MQPCGEQGEDYPRKKLGSEKESKLSTLLILASSCGATLMPQEEARISKVEIYTKKEDDIQVQKPAADEGSLMGSSDSEKSNLWDSPRGSDDEVFVIAAKW